MTVGVTCAGAQWATLAQGEVFGEALWKWEYCSGIELETQGTMDTLLKERESFYKYNSHKELWTD